MVSTGEMMTHWLHRAVTLRHIKDATCWLLFPSCCHFYIKIPYNTHFAGYFCQLWWVIEVGRSETFLSVFNTKRTLNLKMFLFNRIVE